MDQKLILITLLVKLGVAAAVASAVGRSKEFKRLLFREDRTFAQTVGFISFMAVPIGLGIIVRQNVRNFLAADISFESVIIVGVMGGPLAGALYGVLVGAPALLNQEYLAMPFFAAVGFLCGMLRNFATDHEEIWSFSPFLDVSVYRWIKRNIRKPRLDWQTSFFLVIIALAFAQQQLGRSFPGMLFYLDIPRTQWLVLLADYATTIAVVAIPLKIWNLTRIEMKLEEQERLLLMARMEALQSQINPHFLFNTLNSISSLTRVDPETARDMIVKLANILRRILSRNEAFVQLREEIEFIDDYLDIEVVRFGRDKLRVTKELDPASLDVVVPAMILQPIVENAIKHGLAPRVEGGSITLRSSLRGERVMIEVEDDGVGVSPTGTAATSKSGIGMANVAERLKVLYGENAGLTIGERDGQGGTRVTLDFPVLEQLDSGPVANAATVIYEARSSTER
ncbi:MAG: histidine kinase [Acidobacteriota bacterium]|nr:histidine kinase [Acidobacteriota bacterium]